MFFNEFLNDSYCHARGYDGPPCNDALPPPPPPVSLVYDIHFCNTVLLKHLHFKKMCS